ncbi:MAG: hypothetical protein ACR5LF_12930 [Symbiopectobacterium sp.]
MKHAPGLVALFVTTTLHAATIDLCILETTDLHSNMMDCDLHSNMMDWSCIQ